MKNIETNIKKYSYDTPNEEIHQIIKNNEININNINNDNNNVNKNIYINKTPSPKLNDKRKRFFQSLSPNKNLTTEERDNIMMKIL